MTELKENIKWIWDRSLDIFNQFDVHDGLVELKQIAAQRAKQRRKRKIFYLSAAAVAALLVIVAGLYTFTIDRQIYSISGSLQSQVIKFGEEDFVIKVENRIFINEFTSGSLEIKDGEVCIYHSAGREVIATSSNADVLLHIPKGMRYNVTLEDGSEIWIGSNSSLSFPVRFSEVNREVKADGHLYFQVNSSKTPFTVAINEDVSIRVYGTIFSFDSNRQPGEINAYLNEGSIAFKIGETEHLMLPNQKLVYNTRNRSVVTDEIEAHKGIYWKERCLHFNNVSLEDLAREISDWFNVSVQFHDKNINDIVYTGNIPDFLNLNEITEILNATKQVNAKYKNNVIHFYSN